MDNLINVTKMVKEVLEVIPQSRNSDNFLYYVLCDRIARQNGIDINKVTAPLLLLNTKEFGFPCFETVRRSRQKLQATNPELAANADVEKHRATNEEIYRSYARNAYF